MIKSVLGAMAVLVIVTQGAVAADKPGIVHRVSCTIVRFYVAKYSAGAAESWARSHGASEAEVDSARRCLSSNALQTASVVR
jgi:hypothetical protein